jgi:hypothetical protein
MAKKVQKKKQSDPVPDVVKTFYRVQPKKGGWTLVTVKINQDGEILESNQSEEDILVHTLYRLERLVKDEFGV